MTSNQPNPTDAILGNNTPAPINSGILGGIDGIRQKLATTDLTVRLAALDQAWAYGDAGKACLTEMLSDRSKTLRRRARWLLRQSEGTTLLPEPVWNLTERLGALGNYGHATRFANRNVQTLVASELNSEIAFSPEIAYALHYDYGEDQTVNDQLAQLLTLPNIDRIEALVIGLWDDNEAVCTGTSNEELVSILVAGSDRLPNLKALFIGDIPMEECEISWLEQSDLSAVLQAYPQLEILQARGGIGLRFAQTATHSNLKSLILETGGLSRETLYQIYDWDFPALEHLEFWFGSDNYGGDCWEQDLATILDDLKFPNLTYLGLRNAKFADEMMDRLLRSPVLAGLQVLDISMGTLGDEGAVKLLECEAIKDLETLNVADSYLSGAMIDQLNTLGIRVIAESQREEDDDEDPEYRRYCSITE
jgi:hypothetical protein